MNQFDAARSLAQSFIERRKRVSRGDEIAAVFQQAPQTLGFRYFVCWSHADPLRPRLRVVI